MNIQIPDEAFFDRLGSADATTTGRAPSRLKAKIYSALLRLQVHAGPLLSVTKTRAQGRGLCVFENLARIAPIGEKAKSFNFCSVCHARFLSERIENVPIFWRHCPYVSFRSR